MPLEHAFSRFGFQDNPRYGKRDDMRGLVAKLDRYRKGSKAYSVIRSWAFWLEVMSRHDFKAWKKRGAQIRAMIVDCHTFPDAYIKNNDKSGMINMLNYEIDKQEARVIVGKRQRSTDLSALRTTYKR